MAAEPRDGVSTWSSPESPASSPDESESTSPSHCWPRACAVQRGALHTCGGCWGHRSVMLPGKPSHVGEEARSLRWTHPCLFPADLRGGASRGSPLRAGCSARGARGRGKVGLGGQADGEGRRAPSQAWQRLRGQWVGQQEQGSFLCHKRRHFTFIFVKNGVKFVSISTMVQVDPAAGRLDYLGFALVYYALWSVW